MIFGRGILAIVHDDDDISVDVICTSPLIEQYKLMIFQVVAEITNK